MILIQQVHVYAPQDLGIKDVLLAGTKIERIADHMEIEGAEVIDGRGKSLTPGFIDQHVHITGGGGEGSFHTKAPEVKLSELLKGGITTVLGLLGTDGFSRDVENLVAKAKGLKEEGISAYTLTGSYTYPSVTLSGDLKKDIMFIDEMLGVKLAISDHRSSQITLAELNRIASDARVAGMLSGKPGFVTLHMGDDHAALSMVRESVNTTTIPITIFRPTHVNRNPYLYEEALGFLEMGGFIDLTCALPGDDPCAEFVKQALERGIDTRRMTISSDGQGSYSDYDEDGNLTKIGVASVAAMLDEFQIMVRQYHFPMEQALTYMTSNVAEALSIQNLKGYLKEGWDADALLFDEQLELDSVFAKGRVMMKNHEVLVKGTFE